MSATDFHTLANLIEVAHERDFTFRRSQAIAEAARAHRDFSVVRLAHVLGDSKASFEIVIVDVECHGVPPKNAQGIRFRERLALCVPEDPIALVHVLALRKSFPVFGHQNAAGSDGPASLCLYYEPLRSVSRTWTAQRFLRRVQWWLEAAARGELHAADQPVENLFFVASDELIVPWNFDELMKAPGARFTVRRLHERAGSRTTWGLEPVGEQAASRRSAMCLYLTVPPVVHGVIERDPATLGELDDILQRRGVTLMPQLREALTAGLDERGWGFDAVAPLVIFVLNIPIVRELGGRPERFKLRAFATMSNAGELGVALGAMVAFERHYYRDTSAILGAPEATAWRASRIQPLEVLTQNSAAAARQQSGLGSAGPRAVLIGAGSLGSALLNLWSRAGWGQWTVIDVDHIKPHNLSRHTAFSQHIGQPKADVVAELNAATTDGATTITPITADACLPDNTTVGTAFSAADVVIDASATLEYPRLASTRSHAARHLSVFITPNGNGAILMAEDAARRVRLRTLEAQYYRHVMRSGWGERHLDGNLGTYWSGASCRDISTVMPYSSITVHASTLADQVRFALDSQDARLRVWDRDPETGAVNAFDLAVTTERAFELEPLTLYLDEGVAQQLRALRAAALPNETGGVLLGYHDFNIGAIVVVDALAAPPDSVASRTGFERGVEGLRQAVAEASRRTAGVVDYVGDWHSHPRGHSARPSGDDFLQLIHLALGMHLDGLPAVQLIVGENDIRVLSGKVGG